MIILRAEKKGGVIFNTENGTQAWLDEDGFDFCRDLSKGGVAHTESQKELFTMLKLELGVFNLDNCKLIHKTELPLMSDRPYSQLSAPVLVDLQITNKCNLACPHCYAESGATGNHLPLEKMMPLFNECSKLGVLEIALGGGEPTLHPEFEEILKTIRNLDMVPNLATNGRKLSWRTAKMMKKYVGAVALSVEFTGDKFLKRRGFEFWKWLISVVKLKAAGLRLVFQLTVSKSNIDELPEIVEKLIKLRPYAIIFLTYKPAGRGEKFDAPLKTIDFPKVKTQLASSFAKAAKSNVRLGYDCCLGNALVGWGLAGDEEIQGCSALRSSVAVNADLDVFPCSFSAASIGNLSDSSLVDIWTSRMAEVFRDQFDETIKEDQKCISCNYKKNCLGGCPEFELVSCYNK